MKSGVFACMCIISFSYSKKQKVSKESIKNVDKVNVIKAAETLVYN